MYKLKLFARIVKLRFLAKIEYPLAYLMGIAAQWFAYGTEVILAMIMVSTFGALNDWLPMEIVMLYGLWLVTYAIGAAFVFNTVNQMPQMAISGMMDEALVKPIPPLFFLIATNFNVGYISHLLLGSGVIAWSYLELGLGWHIGQWLWFVVLILSGAAIMGATMFIFALPALKLRARSPLSTVYFEGRSFSKYPLSIYPKVIQFFLTCLLPYGFTAYYPMMALLGKSDPWTGRGLVFLSPGVAVALVWLAGYCWRRTISKYESAGT